MARLSRSLLVTNPDAAGIDIGSSSHFVAVPSDRDEVSVREFSSLTCDLQAIATWLKICRVRTVAMESTGVYWIALYELLEAQGFEVLLVNARHVKNVSGRKSDVLDCQWLHVQTRLVIDTFNKQLRLFGVPFLESLNWGFVFQGSLRNVVVVDLQILPQGVFQLCS